MNIAAVAPFRKSAPTSPDEEVSQGLTVGQMVQRYFRWKDVASNANSKRAYHYEISRLAKFVGEESHVDALNRFSLHSFARYLHESGLALRSRNHALSYARDLVRWASSAGIFAEDFSRTVKLRRVPKTMPQVPTEREMQALINGAPASAWPDRDRCIAEFLYCNLRVCEVSAVDLGDIVGADLLVHGKGRRERKAFLTPSATNALALYLPNRETLLGMRKLESNALFINQRNCQCLSTKSIHRTVKALAYAAGLDKRVSPVKLRGACATHMLNNGAALSAVSQLLGHENIATTMYYVGAVSPKRMRESYDNAFKR